MRGKNRCYVCFKKHDYMCVFPEGFPNKMKWCCDCKDMAEFITEDGLEETIKQYKSLIKYFGRFNTFLIVISLRKLNKLITVV